MDYDKSEVALPAEIASSMQQDYRELNAVELALIGGGIGDVIVG